MTCETYSPISALSPFVEHLWFISNDGKEAPLHLVCPNGSMDLVVHLDDREFSIFSDEGPCRMHGPLLAGPYSKAFYIDLNDFTAVVGARFKPGAARVFFPVPAHELHNVDITLGDAYPESADRLRNDLLSTRGSQGWLAALQDYLLDRLAGSVPLDPLVAHAVRELQRHRGVADVRSEVGLSHTRFVQVFRESVGMGPKLFCRVRRFQKALQCIQRGSPVNWAELATRCGYFDQAHLIRDFREFSGLTPLAYLEKVQGALAFGAAS